MGAGTAVKELAESMSSGVSYLLYDIECYTYSIENNKLLFDSLED